MIKILLFLIMLYPLILLGQGKASYIDTVKVEALCSLPLVDTLPLSIEKHLKTINIAVDDVFLINIFQIREHTYYYNPRIKKEIYPIKILGYLWEDKEKINKELIIWKWKIKEIK